MNKRSFLLRIALLFLIPLMGFMKDHCKSDGLYKQAVSKLSKYTLVKDYRVYMKSIRKLDAEDYEYYTIPLNRGVKYKFLGLSSPDYEGKLIMNLYNSPNRDFLFASTYNATTKVVKESLEFKCETTGNFCVGYYMEGGKEGCGVAVYAFQQ